MCDATNKNHKHHNRVTIKSHQSRGYFDTTELVIISGLGIFLGITTIAVYEYIKQIRLAHNEYIKAKNFIEEIVLSFDRELKRESSKFDKMVTEVNSIHITAATSHGEVERVEKLVDPLKDQVEMLSQSLQSMSKNVDEKWPEINIKSTQAISKLSELTTKIRDIENTQELLKTSIANFEENIKNITTSSTILGEEKEAAFPLIPIRRDKALAALTDTEIQVLEMLLKEGPKTAPEIKERVHLSREHTARLMKKLYEDGYLEREAGKIPFRYSLKKEMETLLQKTENSAA